MRIAVHPGRRALGELRLPREGARASAEQAAGAFSGGRAVGLPGEGSLGPDAMGLGSIGLDPSLTFTSFVTGTANVLAANAAQRMAAVETPQFSPLYLKAATGQGKTHLLHAIGHAFLAAHPRARIFYCSAERFMVEFVQALRQNQTIEFKARLRGFDLLLVDDIQFIIGKASAQGVCATHLYGTGISVTTIEAENRDLARGEFFTHFCPRLSIKTSQVFESKCARATRR